MLEQYLEDNEDDDDSYLKVKGSISRVWWQDSFSFTVRLNTEVSIMKTSLQRTTQTESIEQAIQDMYWPFHRYCDIQGRRRINPIRSSLVTDNRKKAGQIRQSEPSPTQGHFLF